MAKNYYSIVAGVAAMKFWWLMFLVACSQVIVQSPEVVQTVPQEELDEPGFTDIEEIQEELAEVDALEVPEVEEEVFEADVPEVEEIPDVEPAVGEEETELAIRGGVTIDAGCGDASCWYEHFAECVPGNATYTILLAPGAVVEYLYEITGAAPGGCAMKSTYVRVPAAQWQGESMTCVYDNTKEFDVAVEEIFPELETCEGALKELFVTT